jgi:hypothetical protein
MDDLDDMDDLDEMDGMEGLGRVGFAGFGAFAFLFASFAVEREIYRKGRKVKDAKLAKRSGVNPPSGLRLVVLSGYVGR